jgi:hypothetical protein
LASIAADERRSAKAVRRELLEAGLSLRRGPDPEKQRRIVERYLAGESITYIVAEERTSTNTIYQLLELHDIPRRYRRHKQLPRPSGLR